MLTRFGAFAAICSAALYCGGAFASNVQVDTFKYPGGGTSSPSVTISGYGTVLAGEFVGLLDGNSFNTYCTELKVFAGWGVSKVYGVELGTTQWGLTKANDLNRLFTNYYSAVNDVVTSQAMQFAVWEIIYESSNNPYNVTSGSFSLDGVDASETQANQWLANLGTLGANYKQVDALVNPYPQVVVGEQKDFQNYLVVTQVPEPEAYGLALAGMGVVAFAMRRRKAENKG